MKKEKVEAANLLEEAKEIFEECSFCGICKSDCPVFRVLREESKSPRGFAILLQKGVLSKEVFQCTLCGACEFSCPKGIKIREGILKARQALNILGKNTKFNKGLLDSLRKKGRIEKK